MSKLIDPDINGALMQTMIDGGHKLNYMSVLVHAYVHVRTCMYMYM